jgi:hypothetical protein
VSSTGGGSGCRFPRRSSRRWACSAPGAAGAGFLWTGRRTRGRRRCRPRPRGTAHAAERSGLFERGPHAFQPAAPLGDDFERHVEIREVRVRIEPCLRRSTQAPLLLRRHHLERIAEAVAALALDLSDGSIVRPAPRRGQRGRAGRRPARVAETKSCPRGLPLHVSERACCRRIDRRRRPGTAGKEAGQRHRSRDLAARSEAGAGKALPRPWTTESFSEGRTGNTSGLRPEPRWGPAPRPRENLGGPLRRPPEPPCTPDPRAASGSEGRRVRLGARDRGRS